MADWFAAGEEDRWVGLGASRARTERVANAMVVGQRMGGAEPTEADLETARRQIAGELTGDQAAAEALAAAQARFTHQ